jgi:hypothetical protein
LHGVCIAFLRALEELPEHRADGNDFAGLNSLFRDGTKAFIRSNMLHAFAQAGSDVTFYFLRVKHSAEFLVISAEQGGHKS